MPRRTPQFAKLTRPRLARAIARGRLFKLLDEACETHPAVCVVGPPGAGKTTLVASWLDSRGTKGIWYQVDPGDADLATFFYYLGLATQPFTRKGGRPLPLLTPEHLGDVRGFSQRYFRELFSRLPEAATLVLDNYQEVPVEQRFHELVAEAVDEVPPGFTLIVVSRHAPPECYARLIANQRVAAIDWGALKLNLEEARAIGVGRVDTATGDIAHLHQMSEGWAAGFILLLERLRQGEDPRVVGQSESLRAVFDYFAGQLFDRAAPDTQRLLLRLSFLPRMNAAAARKLTGSDDALALLEDLHRRHLFIDRRQTGEPVYQFHALLQAFLQHRTSKLLSLSEQRELTLTAARVLEQSSRPEEALPLYLKADAIDAARILILREAPRLIGQGRWKMVVEWIEALPQERVEGDCWLMHWLGTATTAIEPLKSRATLEKSYGLAEREQDELCQAQAAAGIIATYMAQYTHFRPLDRWISVLENKLTGRLVFPNCDTELRIESALLIALAFRQPGNPRLASCVERVFELLQDSVDINLRASAATYLLRYGATTGPLEVSRRALLQLESLLKHPEVTALNAASGFAAISWFHCLCRNRQACREACVKAEQIAEEHGLASPTKVALINRMWLALFAFDALEGRRLLERVERIVNRAHPFDLASLHGARSWIALCENKLDAALHYCLKAVEFFDEAGSVMHSVNFRIGFITILIANRQFDSARQAIEQVREIAGECITAWQRSALWAFEASVALEEGNRGLTLERLAVVLPFARACGDDFSFSNWCRPWMPRLCQEALSAGIEVPYVRDLIRRYEFPPPSPFTEHWCWPVKIYTLGQFKIVRGDESVQFGRKAPRRVLAVLKYIVAYGSEGVPLKQLADAVWPDQDGDTALRALGVALARLRKVIGGHDLLLVNDERVSVNLQLVWIDTYVFESLVNQIDADISVVDAMTLTDSSGRLLSLYRGAFLPGDHDEPWVLRPRLRLRARFVRCLISLGSRLEACGRWEPAVNCYLRGLETDDLVEEFYQGLMRSYGALAQPAQGLAAFERLRRALSMALGVVPSPASEGLAHRLQSQRQAPSTKGLSHLNP